jgi:hypothetical protein
MKRLVIIIICTIGIQSISFCCSCTYSLKEYKKIVKSAIKDSRNIYVASVKDMNENSKIITPHPVYGCKLNPLKIWKGKIPQGKLIGQIPDKNGLVMTSSCDRPVKTNSTYLFLTSSDRISLCASIILLTKEEVETVSTMDLKKLKKFLMENYKNQLDERYKKEG